MVRHGRDIAGHRAAPGIYGVEVADANDTFCTEERLGWPNQHIEHSISDTDDMPRHGDQPFTLTPAALEATAVRHLLALVPAASPPTMPTFRHRRSHDVPLLLLSEHCSIAESARRHSGETATLHSTCLCGGISNRGFFRSDVQPAITAA